MSHKVLIIGNGFDLRHFLPTKYNHFICILKDIEKTDINKDFNFNELFDNEFLKYDSYFYNQISEFYNTEELLFEKDDLISIKNRLQKNLWFRHFKSIDDSHIETWIDFETEINRVLESIVLLFDKLDERIKKSESPFNGQYYYDYRYNNPDYFESSLSRILLTNLEIFIPFNSYQFTLNDNYYFKIGDDIQLIHKNKILTNLYDSLQEFTGIFNDYFNSIVSKFYQVFKEDRKNDFLSRFNINLLSSIDKVYSFNYTNTVEKLYNFKNIDFVHGHLTDNSKDINNLKIVLGVDDLSSNLKEHKLFNFTKYFQKLHKQTDYQFLHNNNLSYPYTFYFWGHSLDISDQEYIKEVFNLFSILEDRRNSKIIIFYHSIQSKADQLNNLLSIIGKETIENLMKNKKLLFIQSTKENLYNSLVNNI